MKKIVTGAIVALLSLSCVMSVLAADVKPVVNDSGKLRPAHTGETVGVLNGGTGSTTASGARTNLSVYSKSEVDTAVAGAGTTITYKDEGSNLTTSTTSVNCVGNGIACTNTSGAVTATVDLASPPSIGATTPAAGKFSTLQATSTVTTALTGSTQCVYADSSGVLHGTGAACGGASGASDFVKIATVTTAAAQTSINFTSIPGTYTHLKIVGQLRGGGSDSVVMVQLNTDTNKTNYTATQLQGAGGSASSATFAGGNTFANIAFDMPSSSTTAGNAATIEMTIANYAGTSFNKSYYATSGNPSANVKAVGGHWANTAAVTQVTLVTQNGQAFANGLVITLYGLN